MKNIRKIMAFITIGLFIGAGSIQSVSCENTEKSQIIVPLDDSVELKEGNVHIDTMNQGILSSLDSPFSNSPPGTPARLVGPTKGTVTIGYPYYTCSVDPDDDPIQYGIDFNNDGMIHEDHWTGFYPSGDTVTVELKFHQLGTYPLRVKARDIHGAESMFSEVLYVEISYEGRTIHVPDDFPTIQMAINAAYYGDSILVEAGWYYENIVIDKDQYPIKTINIIGENKETTVIDAGGSDAAIRINSDCIRISGFTIRNGGPIGGSYVGSGIHLDADYCTIFNNMIMGNDKSGLLIDGDYNLIKDNTFLENVKWGVYASNFGNEIYHNNFMDNGDHNAWDKPGDNTWYDTFSLEGNYWDDYTGSDNDGDGIGDTAYGISPYPEENKDEYPFMEPDGWDPLPPPLTPDLKCVGTLNWVDVQPGADVTGTFDIMNDGDPESLLNWEIVENPPWGDWTVEPVSGEDLTPEDGEITVLVVVEALDIENTQFNGEIIVENTDDPSDSCVIPVSLTTPKRKTVGNPLVRFLYNHQSFFPFFRSVLHVLWR